jgi:Ran GTPase-activating protein (RanGAP) involved in mRNA processing and transport
MYNQSLETLSMNRNKVEAEGVEALENLLRINKTLKELSLSNCYLRDEGLKIAARGLKKNESLRHLYMGYSFATRLGVWAVVDTLLVGSTHL